MYAILWTLLCNLTSCAMANWIDNDLYMALVNCNWTTRSLRIFEWKIRRTKFGKPAIPISRLHSHIRQIIFCMLAMRSFLFGNNTKYVWNVRFVLISVFLLLLKLKVQTTRKQYRLVCFEHVDVTKKSAMYRQNPQSLSCQPNNSLCNTQLHTRRSIFITFLYNDRGYSYQCSISNYDTCIDRLNAIK